MEGVQFGPAHETEIEHSVEKKRPKTHKPDHIGHVLVTAESKPDRPDSVQHTKHIETLSRAELLAYSDRIEVDGSTLRQIYETHLIGERGLRRLVAEHLKGGDLKKALRREITEREIDFERDPAMRDLAIPDDAFTSGGSHTTNAALDQLLKQADEKVAAANPREETAFYKARAHYEASQLERHQQNRKLIDVALAATITVLLFSIIVLFLKNR